MGFGRWGEPPVGPERPPALVSEAQEANKKLALVAETLRRIENVLQNWSAQPGCGPRSSQDPRLETQPAGRVQLVLSGGEVPSQTEQFCQRLQRRDASAQTSPSKNLCRFIEAIERMADLQREPYYRLVSAFEDFLADAHVYEWGLEWVGRRYALYLNKFKDAPVRRHKYQAGDPVDAEQCEIVGVWIPGFAVTENWYSRTETVLSYPMFTIAQPGRHHG